MKSFTNSRKFLFGVSVSMVLAMAIGSFALNETQTPASPQEVEAQSAVGATAGPFTVEGGTQGTDFDYANSVLTIHSGNLTVSTTAQTAERIVVDGAATITLAGVNIDRTSETENAAALTITDDATFNVNILLTDGSTNILKGRTGGSSSPGSPGIQKNGSGDSIGTLTIGVPSGSAGNGKLEATGGNYGAGIGGGYNGSGSAIEITGGEVTATGGYWGAGIGGGSGGSGSNITINGGEVTATGSSAYGAGIGGGYNGSGSAIEITGGEVTATGGWRAAGIGGGRYGNGSDITISGGVVTATGGDQGAGIGDGHSPSTSGSGNSLNGDAVVLATSGDATKPALEGFVDDQQESLLIQGIAFTRQTTSGVWSGTMYGNSVKITEDVEFPADLTISANKQVTVGENTTLTIPENVTLATESGATLTVANGATLKNDGTVIESGTVVVGGTITTKTDFYLEGSTDVYTTGYQTYKTSAGVQNYNNLPNPYQLDPANGKRLINWYYLNQTGQEVAISENVNVLLNEHSFHENSVEQFTVTFSVPTGTAPAAQTIDDGSKATDPQLSWADGTVEGWYKDQAFTPANKWNFNTDTVTGNITLYARFQYTVTFNVPTGTAPQAQNVDIGGKATDPQFSWTDGTVEGWYKENTYKNKWNFSTDTVTGNITLYAKFTCSVTFNSQGGSTVAGETVVYDNTVQEPDEPTRDDGYSFVEWCKDEECTIAWDFENDRVQGDMTLYAKWIGDEHRVIIPTNPDGHGTVTTDPENPKTGDEVIITVTPEEGYEIDGLPIVKTEDGRIIEVVPTGNPNEYKFIMPDSDVTIEVHFVRISEPEVKTGDSFTGIAALAILGLATTGAVLVRKRK